MRMMRTPTDTYTHTPHPSTHLQTNPTNQTRLVDVGAVRVLEDARAVGDQDLGGLAEEEDAVGAALVEHEALRLVVHELLWCLICLLGEEEGEGGSGTIVSMH
jgi:hypothetical protein